MRAELKMLGISCLVTAVVLVSSHAQDSGGAPPGAAPAAGDNAAASAGGLPPGAAGSDGQAGGMPAAAGGAPGGAPNTGGGDAAAGGAPGGGMPAAAGGAPGGAPGGGAPGGGMPSTAGGAPGGSGGGMPPGTEGADNTPAPAESSAQQKAEAAEAAADAKRAQQEEQDKAAIDAALAADDKVQRVPHPAYMVPLAAKSLMLGVAQAGDRLVAAGSHGDIVYSSDGEHWTQAPTPVRQPLTAITFADANNGWAVGHDSVILHTDDGGLHWSLQSFRPSFQAPLLNLLFLDAQHGFAFGAFGQLSQTQDGGKTWTDVAADNIRGDQLNFYAMIKLGDGALLLVGEQGTLALSTDQGATWKKLTSPYKGSFFGALPVGDKGALVFGLRGNVYLTDDVSAGPWHQVVTNTKASFFGGARLADGRFVLVGSSGAILTLSADGSQVTPVNGPSDQDYDAVLPYKGGLVFAGAGGMQLLKSLH